MIVLSPRVMTLHNAHNCAVRGDGQGADGGYTLYIHVLLHRSVKYSVNHFIYILVYTHYVITKLCDIYATMQHKQTK